MSVIGAKENVPLKDEDTMPRANRTDGFPGFSLDENAPINLNTANFGDIQVDNVPVWENKLSELSKMLKSGSNILNIISDDEDQQFKNFA